MVYKKILFYLFLFCFITTGFSRAAQPGNQSPGNNATDKGKTQAAPTVITEEQLQTKIKEVEALKDMPAETKTKVLDLYKQAITQLKQVKDHQKLCNTYKESIESAPKQTKEMQAQQKAFVNKPVTVKVDPKASAKDLTALIAKEQADLAADKSNLEKLDTELKNLQDRPKKAREEQEAAKKVLEDLKKSLKAKLPEGENPLLKSGSEALLKTRFMAKSEEIAMLEQEILSSPMRLDLLTAKKAMLKEKIVNQEKRLDKLGMILKASRSKEADAVASKMEKDLQESSNKHKIIKELAEQNVVIGKTNDDIVKKDGNALEDKKTLEAHKGLLEESFKRIKQQLERVGLYSIPSKEMQSKRAWLPELTRGINQIEERWHNEIPTIESERFKQSLEQQKLGNLDKEIEKINKEKLEPSLSNTQRQAILSEVREKLKTKAEALKKLNENYDAYLKTLREIESLQNTIRETAQQFMTLLDENLLWIPSTSLPGKQTLVDSWLAVGWLFSGEKWWQTIKLFSPDVKTTPFLVIALLVVLLLLGLYKKILATITESGVLVGKVLKDKISITIKALFLTGLLAAPLPLFLGVLGWSLLNSVTRSPLPFAMATGQALLTVSGLMFALFFFQKLCMPGGVGEAHFKWKPKSTALFRHHLRWVLGILVATTFLVVIFQNQSNEAYRNSLGRLVFLVEQVALTIFIRSILKPDSGITADILKQHPSGWLSKFKYIWYPLSIGIPIILGFAAIVGYYYTALELQNCMIQTAWLIVSLIIIRQLALRWLFIEQRRLALKTAQKKREDERKAAAKEADYEKGQPEVSDIVEEIPEIEISTINEQSRKLIQTLVGVAVLFGLWAIWSTVLPALSILNNVTLWSIKTTDNTGALIPQAITLQDLTLSFIALILTVAAAKNLPGALEIIVLKRLPIVPGIRYAISTLSQYVLAAIGIIIAFNVIGVGWSKVQWLVAALSVGIGFGLQEIIANFFCGIILLFERPIRIGDIVTVGDVMGVVSRIRIRATTITNWDRMEYVVPNKELITGHLLNWTLTNSINRIVIKVGVAYGSDVQKVYDIIVKIAQDQPLIMKDPSPLVTMEGFGDSSLDFVLRCYMADFDKRMQVIHELHASIYKAFSEAGIEIPFPQHDIHMRSGE